MTKVMLTGSNGFVGQKVREKLAAAGYSINRAVRTAEKDGDAIAVGSIGPKTDWRLALEGCDAVIHLAAALPGRFTREHYLEINDEGTRQLVEHAIDAGVKCLIAISSIAAVGGNHADEIVSDRSPMQPVSEYGRSKLAAEAHVAAFASGGRSGISLRPPLVYGARAKGNWNLLQKLAATGLPLPFGTVHNRRSMISIDNLADAVVTALRGASPENAGAYAVADNESVSLAQIVTWLRAGVGKPARLVPLPSILLTAPLKLAGLGAISQSLFGNLEIDGSRFQHTFDWSPHETSMDAILRSGKEFAAIQQREFSHSRG